MELSKQERLILYNQFKILKLLDTENERMYEKYLRILEYGYRRNYDVFGKLKIQQKGLKNTAVSA